MRAPAPTMPPAPVPAPFAPGRAPARAPVATRVATRVGTVGQASPSEERKASLALTFGVLAIIVPLAIVGAVHYVANAVAVILALVAIVFARQALGISAVSRGAKTRAGWSLAIGIVVILIWIIALTQGI